MYVKWFDTVMLYYVILVNVTFCHFQISRRSVPVRPDAHRGWNPDDRCRHAPDTLPGTLQEGHRGSAGQGKRMKDRGAVPHGIPECSSRLPLVLHSGIPPVRL
ncbi:unnamed protein product, partial [Staurois parvus]